MLLVVWIVSDSLDAWSNLRPLYVLYWCAPVYLPPAVSSFVFVLPFHLALSFLSILSGWSKSLPAGAPSAGSSVCVFFRVMFWFGRAKVFFHCGLGLLEPALPFQGVLVFYTHQNRTRRYTFESSFPLLPPTAYAASERNITEKSI